MRRCRTAYNAQQLGLSAQQEARQPQQDTEPPYLTPYFSTSGALSGASTGRPSSHACARTCRDAAAPSRPATSAPACKAAKTPMQMTSKQQLTTLASRPPAQTPALPVRCHATRCDLMHGSIPARWPCVTARAGPYERSQERRDKPETDAGARESIAGCTRCSATMATGWSRRSFWTLRVRDRDPLDADRSRRYRSRLRLTK